MQPEGRGEGQGRNRDYVEKNLRVKIPSGKTCTFTDPEGNADRLYAFHQAVEKTRQKQGKNVYGGPP